MHWRKRKTVLKRLHHYTGPYPCRMLNAARDSLTSIVDSKDTVMWYRMRPQMGIYDSKDIKTDKHPCYGDSSSCFSHADLEKGNIWQSLRLHPSSITTTSIARRDSNELEVTIEIDGDTSEEVIEISDDSDVEVTNEEEINNNSVIFVREYVVERTSSDLEVSEERRSKSGNQPQPIEVNNDNDRDSNSNLVIQTKEADKVVMTNYNNPTKRTNSSVNDLENCQKKGQASQEVSSK